MKRLTVLGLFLTLFSSAGCIFGSVTSPTNYTIVSPVTEIFQGTLDAKGSVSYSFVVGNPDPLRVTLASLTNAATGASVTTNVKLDIGTRDGDNCLSKFSTTTTAALVSQYFQVATQGSYCIVVSDPGTVTTSLNFAVRIIHS